MPGRLSRVRKESIHPLIRRRQIIKPPTERNRVMGLFNNLMSKIFAHAAPATVAATAPGAATTPATTGNTPPTQASGAAAATPAAAPAPQVVDVAAVLNDLARKNPEKLDWRQSIVDLMKLVGMDSSLAARKQLATELHYTGNPNDSASMNVWLHKEVLKKLAENGGKVPSELLS
jgi:hypothetical protein